MGDHLETTTEPYRMQRPRPHGRRPARPRPLALLSETLRVTGVTSFATAVRKNTENGKNASKLGRNTKPFPI